MSTAPVSPSIARTTPWWLWLNVLSLDAPIVAVLWQAALARSYRVTLVPGCHLILFLTVWLIYMVDRTLDSLAKTDTDQLSARHAFYRRNRALISIFAIPAVLALAVLLALTAIPAPVMWRGLTLGFLVSVYLLQYAARRNRTVFLVGSALLALFGVVFISILPLDPGSHLSYSVALMLLFGISCVYPWKGSSRLLPKELLCGCLFAVGCSLSVAYYTMDTCATPLSPEVLLLALLFALNCVAISCYEKETDKAFDPASISQNWPGVVRMYPVLLVTLGAASAYMLNQHLRPELVYFTVSIFLSTALLAALHLFAKHLRPDVSRVLADAALALPLILLVVGFGV